MGEIDGHDTMAYMPIWKKSQMTSIEENQFQFLDGLSSK